MRDYEFFMELQAAQNGAYRLKHLDVSPTINVTLKLPSPTRYTLAGAEKRHYKSAQVALGLNCAQSESIDMLGHSKEQTGNFMIILSDEQVNAGIMHDRFIDSRPLAIAAYDQMSSVLRTYAIPTAVCGKITYTSSNGQSLSAVSQENAGLICGPFVAQVDFDTPDGLLNKMKYLRKTFEQIKSNPQASLLDEKVLQQIAQDSIFVRDRIGPLGRYPTPENLVVTCSLDYVREDSKDYIHNAGKSHVIGEQKSGVTIDTADVSGLAQLIEENFFTIDEKQALGQCEILAKQGSKVAKQVMHLHEEISATYSKYAKVQLLENNPALAPYFLTSAKREFDIVKWRFHPDEYVRAYYDEDKMADIKLTNGVLDHFKVMLADITTQHTPSNEILAKTGEFKTEVLN